MRRALRYLSSLLVTVLVLTSCITVGLAAPADAPPTPFADVFGTDYAPAVGPLYALGIVGGVSEHTFGVNQPVTRAQMAAFLVRATRLDKEPGSNGADLFTDVARDHWAAGVIGKAAMSGYVAGYGGKFRPEDQVTEAEAVTMMLRTLGYGSSGLDYPVGYVLKAKQAGLLSDDIPFDLNAVATRGWVAKELARMVFVVPINLTDSTLSQSKFQVATSLAITPGDDFVLPGTTNLTAQGLDWFGKSFPMAQATWQVLAGPATISGDGVLNVTGTGVVQVAAAAGGTSVNKSYDVLQSLVATPATLTLAAGGSASVKVEGVSAGGKRYAVNPKLSVVSGGFTVNGNTVQATGSGGGSVRATLGSLSVDIPVLSGRGLTLGPNTAVLAPGQQQQMQAFLSGSQTPLDSSVVTWSVSGAGTISATGVYTAAVGTAPVITAKAGDLTGSSTLQVISSMSVEPAAAALQVGQDRTFSVYGQTVDGQRIPLSGATCQLNGAVGVLGAGCHMAATAAGQGTLTVSYGSLSATASVSVAGQAARVAVTPDKQSVPANSRSPVTLTVQLQDTSGNPVPGGNNTVNVSIAPAGIGTIDSPQIQLVNGKGTVTFTPTNQVGTVTVVGSDLQGVLSSGLAQFTTYAPVPNRIILTASPGTVQSAINSQSTITATLVDSDNVPIANNAGGSIVVNLSTSGDNLGALNSTSLTIYPGLSSASTTLSGNGYIGTAAIMGTSYYPVVSTTLSAKPAGPAAKLRIRPGYGTATADGTATVNVAIDEVDASGVVRTQDGGVPVSGTLTCGTATYTVSGTLNGGVANLSLKSMVAADCTLVVNSPNMALSGDQATVTFKPGAASALWLSVDPSNVVPADGVSHVNLVAKVTDSLGNLVTTGSYPVTFTQSVNNNATIPPQNMVINTSGGIAKLPVVGNIYQGDDAYTASAPGLTTMQTNGSLNVAVKSRVVWFAKKVDIRSISTATANAGDTVTVTVAVEDSSSYVRAQDNTTVVSLSALNSSAVITPAQQAVTGGVATFTIKDPKAEIVSLTATGNGLTASGATLTYQPGPLTRVTLSADDLQLPADGVSHTIVRVQATDQYGNLVSSNFSVQASVSGSGTLSNSMIYSGAPVTFTAGTTPGTVTIAPVGGNYSVQPVTITLGTPGTPSRLVVDAPATLVAGNGLSQVKVRVYDDHGNVVGSLATGAGISQIGLQLQTTGKNSTTVSNQGAGDLSNYGYTVDGITRGARPAVNGVATFDISDTKAETLTLTPVGYYKGVQLQGQPSTITVVPGQVWGLTVSPNPVAYNADTATNVNLSVALTDAWGNTISGVTDTVTVTVNSNLLNVPSTTPYMLANGVANISMNVKQGSYGSTTATITSSQTGKTTTLTITGDSAPVAPQVWAYSASNGGTTINSGEVGARVVITAPLHYLDQTVMVMVNGVIVPLYTDFTFTTQLTTIPGGLSGARIGYVRMSDLGGNGTKNIQVILQNSLGTSPASAPATITVTP